MEIAMGLFAGVMSGRDNNGCFTYGSGRVKALRMAFFDPHPQIHRL